MGQTNTMAMPATASAREPMPSVPAAILTLFAECTANGPAVAMCVAR
jgi:hypothetical protein